MDKIKRAFYEFQDIFSTSEEEIDLSTVDNITSQSSEKSSVLESNTQKVVYPQKAEMDKIVHVFCELQDIFSTIGRAGKIDLPTIVTIGSQSSGKSSVLESIVQKGFLPRGKGMVTRAPLMLHLIHTPKDHYLRQLDKVNCSGDWAEFSHIPKKFIDFEEVKKEIEKRTDEMAGEKGITSEPIILRLYSENFITLSLVDLPGIIEVPPDGQSQRIVEEIKQMVNDYISRPNTLILAIAAANADLETSQGISFARKVDPNGERTLAVLTKLDIMDRGTNAMDFLLGKRIKFTTGIIGVVNRSQADIDEGKSLEATLLYEERFLKQKYPSIAARNGTKYLERRLNELLMHQITGHFSEVREQIKEKIQELEEEKKMLEADFPDNKKAYCIKVIYNVEATFKSIIDGNTQSDELVGGALLLKELADFDEEMDPFNGFSDEQIKLKIKNANGMESVLLISEKAFRTLLKIEIEYLKEPCLDRVKKAFKIMNDILNMCRHKLKYDIKYDDLRDKIFEVASDLIKKRKEVIVDFVENLVQNEASFINTQNPYFEQIWEDFLELARSKETVSSVQQSIPTFDLSSYFGVLLLKKLNALQSNFSITESAEKGLSHIGDFDRERLTVKIIKDYLAVVYNNLRDNVLKAIVRQLDNIGKELVEKVVLSPNLDDLMEENLEYTERKEDVLKSLKVLKEAEDKLKKIRHISIKSELE